MRKTIKALSILLFLSILFTTYGCGSVQKVDTFKDDSKQNAQQESLAKNIEEKVGETTQADDNQLKTVEITKDSTIKMWLIDTEKNGIEPIIKLFEEKYPKVKVEPVYFKSPKSSLDQNPFLVALAGGDVPDVVNVDSNTALAKFVAAGALLNIAPLVEKDNFPKSAYKGLYEAITFPDGKVYSLCKEININALYYNKDLFDKRGVPYPKDAMSWDEFRQLAKKMTFGEGENKVYGAYGGLDEMPVLLPAYQAGYPLGKEGCEPYILKSWQIWRPMWYEDKSLKSIPDIKAQGTWQIPEFENGKAAMIINQNWANWFFANDMRSGKFKGNIDVVLPPVVEGAAPGTTVASGINVSIGAKSKNQEAAWEWLKYYCGPEGGWENCKRLGCSACMTDKNLEAFYQASENRVPNWLNMVKKTKLVFPPITEKAPSLLKAFNEETELVMIGEKTPEQALEEYKVKASQIK